MSKAFQKAKFYQNLTSGNGSKQRFGLRQLVLKPGFRPKGRAMGM